MPERNITVSVIIPCGRPEFLGKIMPSLNAQDFPRDCFEVLVVVPDQAGAVSSAGADVVVRSSALFPPGRMRNIGIEKAQGRYLCFLDDDCIPPLDWISRNVRTMDAGKDIGIAGCRVVSSEKTFWSRCADYALFSPYQYSSSRFCELGSAAICVRREALSQAGGFDEKLLATEDWDFCLKVAGAGWKCFFDAGIGVSHNHRRSSFGSIVRQGWISGRLSGVTVQTRYYSRMTWLARFSVIMGSAWLYWLLILPYAAANALLQTVPFVRKDPMVMLYSPFILFARLAYHFGVWFGLMGHRKVAVQAE